MKRRPILVWALALTIPLILLLGLGLAFEEHWEDNLVDNGDGTILLGQRKVLF